MVFDLFRKRLVPKEFVLNETRRFGKNIANFVNKTTNQGIKYNKKINSKNLYYYYIINYQIIQILNY